MIYLDTCYIAKCYLNEPGTTDVLKWVRGKDGLSSAHHARLEFWSVIHRHRREGRLKDQAADRVLQLFRRDEQDGIWSWFPLTAQVVRLACDKLEGLSLRIPLRSSDALHLACALEQGFTEIYSNDRCLLAAAPHFGLHPRNIIPIPSP